MVDLGAKQAWRHLVNIPAVSSAEGFVPTIWGQFVYQNQTNIGMFVNTLGFGADGIAISPDGSTLYFSTTGGDQLYSVPTAVLLNRGPMSELMAQASVMNLGHKGLRKRGSVKQ